MKIFLKIFGVFLLNLIYILSGLNKIFNFKKTVDKIKDKFIFNKLPYWFSQFSIIIVILIWTLGSILLLYSTFYKIKIISIILNLLFSILTFIITLYFHNPIIDKSQNIQFLKNMSIIGGFVNLLSDFL